MRLFRRVLIFEAKTALDAALCEISRDLSDNVGEVIGNRRFIELTLQQQLSGL